MIRFCRFSASILLFSFLAFLLVFHFTYAVLPLIAGVLAVLCLLFLGRRFRGTFSVDDYLILTVLVLFSAVWLGDVWRTGQWPVGEGRQGVWLPMWPLLAGLVLLVWRCVPPTATAWWFGVLVGALLAGGIAAYESLWLGDGRAHNGMNPIPFGDLALLLATLSLVPLVYPRALFGHEYSGCKRVLCVLAVFAGLLASVLSGTRGGWVVFPALALILCWAASFMLPRRGVAVWSVLLLSSLLMIALLPQVSVSNRVSQGVGDLEEYVDGERDSSLGIRLEMWEAGWLLIQAKPLLGWGEGSLEARRDEWVAEGRFTQGVSLHDQLHSDMIDTLARRGLLGLLSLLGLYGVPLWLFWHYWRRAGHAGNKAVQREVRAFALCGALVVVAFMGFGLSQSMLRDPRGLAGFLGLLVACWCLLKQAVECQADVGLRPSA